MADESPSIAIFTDLDGTLLDAETYGWEEAEPALDLCRKLNIPVILVSSKTRAEIEVLRLKMGLSDPYVTENGGGIYFSKEGPYDPPDGTVLAKNSWKLALGESYDLLVESLQKIRNKLGLELRGFSDMDGKEISDITGLDPEAARLASLREFDEPFLSPEMGEETLSALRRAARELGLQITEGGRFFHLHGKNDKGEAVRKLIYWYKKIYSDIVSIALGDSPNDFSMMKQVDYPVLIRSKRIFPKLDEELRNVTITGEAGPKGWNNAILSLLTENPWR